MAWITALLISIANAITGIKNRIANEISIRDSGNVTGLYSIYSHYTWSLLSLESS